MADIKFICQNCAKHLVMDEAGAGLTVNCPHCNSNVRVPGQGDTSRGETDSTDSETKADWKWWGVGSLLIIAGILGVNVLAGRYKHFGENPPTAEVTAASSSPSITHSPETLPKAGLREEAMSTGLAYFNKFWVQVGDSWFTLKYYDGSKFYEEVKGPLTYKLEERDMAYADKLNGTEFEGKLSFHTEAKRTWVSASPSGKGSWLEWEGGAASSFFECYMKKSKGNWVFDDSFGPVSSFKPDPKEIPR